MNQVPESADNQKPGSQTADLGKETNLLRHHVGLVDLSRRDRLCLLGDDRQRFLNGQVTNDIRSLEPGQGCYTFVVNNKGIVVGDAFVHCLSDELILDLEPDCSPAFAARMSEFLVADDVEIVDVAPHFGLLSVQGPKAQAVASEIDLFQKPLPPEPGMIALLNDEEEAEIYATHRARTGSMGYDFFVASARLPELTEKLHARIIAHGGQVCGEDSLETIRIENGRPRFPVDMQPSILASELGLSEEAICYTKGCYIGQEVINRIKSIGRVKRGVIGITLQDNPSPNDLIKARLTQADRPLGFITSAIYSGALGKTIALAIAKNTAIDPDQGLSIHPINAEKAYTGKLTSLPFVNHQG